MVIDFNIADFVCDHPASLLLLPIIIPIICGIFAGIGFILYGIVWVVISPFRIYSSFKFYKEKYEELLKIIDLIRSNFSEYRSIQINGQIKELVSVEFFVKALNNKLKWFDLKLKEKINFRQSLNSPIPEALKNVSTFIADVETIDDELSARMLETKKHPAPAAAEAVRVLREEKKILIAQLKTMQYEYELLQQQLPNFTKYCASIEEVVEEISIEANPTNQVYNWLTSAEYNTLSEKQRVQLALNRYNSSWKKSNRRIGYDYELYCGYHLRQGNIWKLREDKPLSVIQYGIEQGLEDQGRDIIAQYRDGKVCIIQCKRWKRDKLIRENVIMQLFGSAAEYCYKHYSNSYNPISKLYNTVIPVLITTTNLSDTAKNFAIRLGIKVVMFDWDIKRYPYPQIKCNINHGNRIYHLPFDDQYDRTIIDEKAGEFYAFTIEEAESKGFRHAMKYYNNYDR